MSASFAFTADIAMAIMGGELKRKETPLLNNFYLKQTSLEYTSTAEKRKKGKYLF